MDFILQNLDTLFKILATILKFLSKHRGIVSYLTSFIIQPILVFIITMAAVYVVGRMTGVVKKDNLKNSIACVIMSVTNFGYMCFFPLYEKTAPQFVRDFIIYDSITILLYVLIGFHLYDIVNSLYKSMTKKQPKTRTHKS